MWRVLFVGSFLMLTGCVGGGLPKAIPAPIPEALPPNMYLTQVPIPKPAPKKAKAKAEPQALVCPPIPEVKPAPPHHWYDHLKFWKS